MEMDFDLNEAKAFMNSSRVQELVKELTNCIQYHKSLDQDFIEVLNCLAEFDGDSVHEKHKYRQLMADLDDNSTVIYFKKAGLLRVYSPKDVRDKLINRINTNYRGRKQLYEVVDNGRPQKILVVIDSRDEQELMKVKNYLLEFTEKKKQPVDEDDLIIFNNTMNNTYEIVVNSWVVQNSAEKVLFINDLLSYIESKENDTNITSKMLKRNESDILNAELQSVPWLKELIAGNIDGVEGFISKCGTRPIVNILINNGIITGDNCEISNNAVSNHVTNNNANDPFIEYLETADLEWYYSGNVIDYDDLYNLYENVGSISKRRFTKKYEGSLFDKTKRLQIDGKRRQQIKLL